ncbi:MAG: tetratricopeptide repeat protein [Mariprofundaceae bacterium]|nr:tetratricopeptide repeat protein [Mariprofundaceae bacterium]
MKYALLFVLIWMLSACQALISPAEQEENDLRAESHYRLGIHALQMHSAKNNLLPKAFKELLIAEEFSPQRADILDALGYAWSLHGNLKKAEAYYVRAIKYDASAATYNNYGGLLLKQGHPKEAEKQFRKALEDPRYVNSFLAYINLGDALLEQSRFSEAIPAYRQAKLLNPNQEVSRMKEAEAYVRYRMDSHAIALYETIVREHPTYKQALQGFLRLLRQNGDVAKIRLYLRTFREKTDAPADQRWAEKQLNLLR